MGKVAVAAAMLALGAAGVADAQRVVQPGPGAGYPMPRPDVRYPPMPPAPVQPVSGSRWGSKIGGRWWGGVNAPGGWSAHRAPQRGWRLPSYWLAPRFRIDDWNGYGFAPPPQGYTWTRYYDDAVLIDARGEVRDTVGGVDWDFPDRGHDGRVASDDRAYERDDRARRDRRGVGGAVAGAVVGGLAGNLIAGGGNRLGGTLIGAGVGAAAGHAVGARRERERDYAPPPPPPPEYREPPPHHHGEDRPVRRPVPALAYPPPPQWTSADGRTTVTVTTSGGGAPVIYAPAHAYGGGVTTITVQVAPVVTTTTTEIVEDSVTWTRPAARKVRPKRLWRPRSKICVCR